MGVCTSDPLTYLIKEYGADVCKYLVSIKAEDFVDVKAPQMTRKLQETFKNTAGSLDKEFDSKQQAIKGNFDSVISSVKESNQQALKKATQSQNKTEEQLFGYDSIKKQFADLRSQKDEKLKNQESNLVNMLQLKKEELKRSIKESRPSLPLFDNMPVCLKQKVLSDGEEKFAPEIKQKQTEITEIFSRITNLQNLQSTIKQAVGLGDADKLVKNSGSTFQKAKKMITVFSNPQMGKSCFG